ncbi:hypothetical protein N7493_009055 [Penicillium malachiteum]|uniref:Mid2 domain-containing protein n=1 Tax=Penicillium malachiteum TaxID=1324776 RepID=A0AAD6HFX0_9EURO|nr:hypothetical protein N7493_009055 [Penicillium malachiteum]
MEGFWYPTSSGSRYIVGDKVNITWQAHAPRISLYETCADDLTYLERNVTNTNSYIWTANNIHFQHNIYGDNGCNFRLQLLSPRGEPGKEVYSSNSFGVSNRTNDDPSPTSYNFYSPNAPTTTLTVTTHMRATTTIGDVDIPTVTISSSSSSESAESSSMTGFIPGTSTTMTLITTSSSAESTGLSSSAKLALEIGLPFGLLILAMLLGICVYQRRKNAEKKVTRVAAVPAGGRHEMGNDTMVSELPGDYPVTDRGHVSELPTVKY